MIASIEAEYRRYKALGEAAIAQVADADLSRPGPGGGNGIAALVWHISGNLASRFTDFRTADGEKPWRVRDDEFSSRTVSREELLDQWKSGWRALFAALEGLTDADVTDTVTVRNQPLRIEEALHRSLAHTAYHVGQLVYLAKLLRGSEWLCLSIPLGGSDAYNRAPTHERAGAHAARLADAAAAVASPAPVDGAAHLRRSDFGQDGGQDGNIVVAREPAASPEALTICAELDDDLRQRYPGSPTNGLTTRDLDDPATVFLVARLQGAVVGCGAMRRLETRLGEVKRMFVRPEFRGRGVGRRILAAIEAAAGAAGMRTLRLETGARQPEAIRLYESAGYRPIPAYGEFVGDPLSRCFEKNLS